MVSVQTLKSIELSQAHNTVVVGNDEIIGWKESAPFALSVFRRKQQKLIKLGFKPQHDITSVEHGCESCGIPRSTVIYSSDALEFFFEVCPNCWECCESFPIYAGGGVGSVDTERLSSRLSLLSVAQLARVDSIVDVLLIE